jgi:VWFA-related protein
MCMPHRLCLTLAFCLASFEWVQHASAQADAVQPETTSVKTQQEPVLNRRLRSDSAFPVAEVTPEGRVQLDIMVTDKAGKPVSGLELKDFSVLDNKQPDKVVSFQAFDGAVIKPDPPVEVILLIDTINQPFELVSDAQQEVEKLLRQNDGHLTQPVSVYWLFDHGLSDPDQSSSDGNALAAGIARQGHLSMPGTNRVEVSVRALGTIAAKEIRKPGRKVLFWIGPGWGFDGACGFYWQVLPCMIDHEPSYKERQNFFDTAVELSTRLREARITLYGISPPSWEHMANDTLSEQGLNSVWEAMPGNLSLRALAVQSGGDVPASFDLTDLIHHSVENANVFYTLSFYAPPAEKPNEYHKLQVLIDKPGLTAHAKAGYYNLLDPNAKKLREHRAIQRVTVAQLEKMLTAAQGTPDGDLARQLSGLELIERLNSAKLSFWKARISGAKASEALVAIADASVFLDPPAEENLTTPPPDAAMQRQMLLRTVGYLSKTISKLPNFFATRTTIRYDNSPSQQEQTGHGWVDDPSLRWAETSTGTVVIRNHKEVVEAGTKRSKAGAKNRELTVEGTFGPILGTVVVDAMASHIGMAWSRWEQGANEPIAIFRFAIPEQKSHYRVAYCCVPDAQGAHLFEELSGYHGEMAIDPASGAVLRLAVIADLKPALPVLRSDIMVEYAPVEIGGISFICPVRSVSIVRAHKMSGMQVWEEGLEAFGAQMTMLNDVVFTQYHRFSSESTIRTGYTAEPERK